MKNFAITVLMGGLVCLSSCSKSSPQSIALAKPAFKAGECYYHSNGRKLERWENESRHVVLISEVGDESYHIAYQENSCAYLNWNVSTCWETEKFKRAEEYYNVKVECPQLNPNP